MIVLNELIKASVIFSTVLAGVIIRNVWDEKVNLPISKVLAGAFFLTIIIYSSNYKLGIDVVLLMVPSLMSGFKCNDLMCKYMKLNFDPLKK